MDIPPSRRTLFQDVVRFSFDDLIQMYSSFPEASYVNWPDNANVSVVDLAAADLIYVGFSDRVVCVHCKGSLHSWTLGDVPADEHRKYYPNCPSLHLEPNEALQCRVCMMAERDTLLMPCAHLVLCGSCQLRLNSCPVCRQPITGSIKVFLS
jgi:hypothetical protein